jgi:hypothetical protein
VEFSSPVESNRRKKDLLLEWNCTIKMDDKPVRDDIEWTIAAIPYAFLNPYPAGIIIHDSLKEPTGSRSQKGDSHA